MKLKNAIYLFSFILFFSCSNNQTNSETIRLGNFQNRPRGFHSVYMPGGQVAILIKNESKEKQEIQSVRYFVGDKGDFSMPFRVMLYSVDSVTGRPAKKLLPENIFLSAVKGNEWISVDMSAFEIILPKAGVFAAMGWLPDDDFNVASQSECQYIAYSKNKNSNQTWYCALGTNWYQLPNCNYNTMISIDVISRSSQNAN